MMLKTEIESVVLRSKKHLVEISLCFYFLALLRLFLLPYSVEEICLIFLQGLIQASFVIALCLQDREKLARLAGFVSLICMVYMIWCFVAIVSFYAVGTDNYNTDYFMIRFYSGCYFSIENLPQIAVGQIATFFIYFGFYLIQTKCIELAFSIAENEGKIENEEKPRMDRDGLYTTLQLKESKLQTATGNVV